MVKTGSGTLCLTGANTYSGDTTVSAGTLDAQKPGALPGYNSSGNVSVADGATLTISVGGSNDWNSSAIGTLLQDAGFAAGATLGIDTSDGNFTYNGDIASIGTGTGTNLGNLEKLGTNTLTLTGTNTYSGDTLVSAGILEAGTTDSLPGYLSGDVTLASGTTLAVSVGGQGDWGSANIDALRGTPISLLTPTWASTPATATSPTRATSPTSAQARVQTWAASTSSAPIC